MDCFGAGSLQALSYKSICDVTSRKYRLSAYDAAYLALALLEQLPLATLDRRLADAARAEGVDVFGSTEDEH